MKLFKHRPLFDGENFRFVILKPQDQSPGGAIYCEIVHGFLDDCPAYEALSYTWGTNVEDKCITIAPPSSAGDQQPLRLGVTENLLNALKRLRQKSERRLWVDRLCIDQINDVEKLQQVHIMWKIYQRASHTILWLGLESPILLRGMEICAKMASLTKGENVCFEDNKLFPFLNLPWFSRLWVIQEVAFSREPVAMLGYSTLPWSAIARTCLCLPDEYMGGSGDSPMKKILWMNELRDLVQVGRRPDLFDVMARGRAFGCSLPVDRIRAMHGLISHSTPAENIGQDGKYAEFKQLFMALAGTMIDYAFSQSWPATLDYITQAGTRNSNPWPEWPSWVPDWTNDKACKRPYEAYFRVTRQKFNADADISMGDSNRRNTWLQRKMLLLDGKHVDTVCEAYDIFEQERELFIKVPLLWQTKVIGSGQCKVDASFRHRFGRTVVADLFLDEAPDLIPEFYALYWRCLELFWMGDVNISPSWLKPSVHRLANNFYIKVVRACKGQRFFVTKSGRLGLCPPETVPGDLVVALYGAKAPFIIRPQPKDYWSEEEGNMVLYQGGYILIGDCYVDGIMYGEAARRSDLLTKEFLIL
jgi:hypothetical protein